MKLPEITIPPALKALRCDVRAVADPVFEVKALADRATISIFDAIGLEVTPARIAAALRQIGAKPITVEINSPGGNYFDGVAIYNLLRRHEQPITVQILGIAASAAAIIAMAGERIEIARNGELMIHRAEGVAIGDADVMADTAALLRQLDGAMADTFTMRSGLSRESVEQLMAAETFMPADEAISLGFADALLPKDAAEKPRLADAGGPQSKRDLEATFKRLGYSNAEAARAAAGAWPALRGKNDEPEFDPAEVVGKVEAQARELASLSIGGMPC